MNWTEDDLNQLQQLSQKKELVEQQIARFKRGVESVVLVSPCTPKNGIELLDPSSEEAFTNVFNSNNKYSVSKFVPASGAASRMFNHLFEQDPTNYLYTEFVQKIEAFAFYADLKKTAGEKELTPEMMVKLLLTEEGLNFAQLPKGAIPFHASRSRPYTAFEEHVKEALAYASFNGQARLHFTVGELFTDELRDSLLQFAQEVSGSSTLKISFSTQFPSTDTIAVTHDNIPFRTEEGTLLFRPGGHGSLLVNLQLIDEDIIFIKNIDNVVPEAKRSISDRYKRVLGGYLMDLVSKRNGVLKALRSGDVGAVASAKSFLSAFVQAQTLPTSSNELINLLDAPMRVAGMVRNEGEPGGGPFWVEDVHGYLRPQIVEKAQIDMDDLSQRYLVDQSTHFNPVDIVCHTKDEKGKKYNLSEFVDEDQAFITEKTVNGMPVKALEHPGLWNGSMSQWLTIFVEVPLATFAPVKTVNDLLRERHQ